MSTADLTRLPDRTVVLALEEITHTLTAAAPTPLPVASAGEAADVIDALFAAARLDPPALGSAGPGAARAVLARLAADEDSAAVSAPVLADPPADDQMGLAESADHIVVIGAVIAWLRLKVDFRFHRKDGVNEVEFELSQKPPTAGYLQELAQIIKDFFQPQP
ncbi:hypothetical protein [Streptomyces kanamyceticus]|uniref:hypothetical protein n=1 Tax=Streptomyces kanamyceticus TaxID=1967 RepID=UPI0006E45BFE|nr:hypothetical protein [Streptomyces kanamyceticus]